MLYKIVVKSNIYVALMITALSAFYQFLFVGFLDKNILWFTFFCSWFFYCFSKINFALIKQKKRKLIVLLISLAGVLYFFKEANFNCVVLFILFFLALTGYLYIFSLFSINLRKIPFLKPFIITFVVIGFVVTLNFLQLVDKTTNQHVFGFFSAYFFVLGIAILFDVRDIKYDHARQLKTFSNSLGINATKFIIILCFIISFLIHTNMFLKPQINLAFYSTLFVSIFVVLSINKNTKPYIYYIFVESCLALPLLILYLQNCLL